MPRAKAYCAGFLLCLLGLVFVLFDFDASQRTERLIIKGCAYYFRDYDHYPPTPNSFRLTYLDPIRKFPRRDTLVLVGNSVIGGAGAKDFLFLNRLLSTRVNVLNAGLPGEFLPASLALATIGINAVSIQQPDTKFSIFIAYPVSRIYVQSSPSGYWATGPALYALAENEGLSDYIYKGQGLHAMGKTEALTDDIRNYFALNMRFFVERRGIMAALRGDHFYLAPTIGSRYQPYSDVELTNPETMEFMRDAVRRLEYPLYREKTVSELARQTVNLERFMDQHHLRYKIHFLLLGDPPKTVGALTARERSDYNAARADFLQEIARSEPSWKVEDANSFETRDFYDVSHLNETGQAALGAKILNLMQEEGR